MSQEYRARGYGARANLSQNYAAPVESPPGYSSRGDFTAGPSQGYAESPGHLGQRAQQAYATEGPAARAYGAQEYADPARAAAQYRAQEYADPARAAAQYRAQEYADPARAAAQYRAQEYADPARAAAQYRFQQYSDPGRPAAEYRTQQYAAPDYGPQGYLTHPYPAPANAPQGQRPAQGYASPGYASPGYASPGYASPGYASPGYASPGYASPGQAGQGFAAGRARQDPWPPGATAPGSAAAASWGAGTPSATQSAGAGRAPSAGAPAPVAEQSAEPLYRVLGGLALRDLTLVESLLELVEQLESREEDPQQLDSLFRVDHLATRMRRNSENLLVLAGQDRESRDFDPVQLLDVARAAVSEIADYDRAQVAPLPSVQVLGVAADDVTHILAELLDNAMSKSPESAEVVIRAERTGDGTLVVSVEDSGIGLPVDRLNEINARLSRLPVVDVAVTRHMGLYVVGRLAHRHGIRVQLRERPYGGIVASVIIPSQLIRNDPDGSREAIPFEAAGRFQPLGGAGVSAPQLSIEARGADGLRAQPQGALQPGTRVSAVRDAGIRQAAPFSATGGQGAGPGAGSGIGWPVSLRQEADRERPAPAPAAGYPDAVPVPRFEPADPAGLPKRKPGALSAANGIPAPPDRGEKVSVSEKAPVSTGDEPAVQSEAQRIRDELSEFQLGQRAARNDISDISDISVPATPEPGDLQGDSQPGTVAGTDTGAPADGASAEAGDNDGS
jgi:hypothetical protein